MNRRRRTKAQSEKKYSYEESMEKFFPKSRKITSPAEDLQIEGPDPLKLGARLAEESMDLAKQLLQKSIVGKESA